MRELPDSDKDLLRLLDLKSGLLSFQRNISLAQ